MARPNKLECLHLAKTFQYSLTFAVSTRSIPKKEYLKGPPIGFALALHSNSKTRLERVTKGKPSSCDEGIKFYDIDTRRADIEFVGKTSYPSPR